MTMVIRESRKFCSQLGPIARSELFGGCMDAFHADGCVQRRRATCLHCISRERADRRFLRSRFFFLFFFSAHRDCLFWQWMSMFPVALTLCVL